MGGQALGLEPCLTFKYQQCGQSLHLPEKGCCKCFVCSKLKPQGYIPLKPDLVCFLLILRLAEGKKMEVMQRFSSFGSFFSSLKTIKGFLEFVTSIFLSVCPTYSYHFPLFPPGFCVCFSFFIFTGRFTELQGLAGEQSCKCSIVKEVQ